MGEDNWETAVETIICNVCAVVTPPPPSPIVPINVPINQPIPEPQPQPEPEPRLRLICVPPSLGEFIAAAQQPVDETPGAVPGGANA